jgi:heptosyltransferase-3
MEIVLVYRFGQLGDTICAIPAIQAVRENLKPCRIVLLADIHPGAMYPKAQDVLSEFGLIDDSIVYNPDEIFSSLTALEIRRQIMQRKIKKLVYLVPRPRTRLQRVRDLIFFKWCGIHELYGLRLLGDSIQLLSGKHEIEKLMDILRMEGFKIPMETTLSLPILEDVKCKIGKTWMNLGLEQKTVIAIGCGSKMPVKRWELDNYRRVGEILIEKYGVQLIILGGKEDSEPAEILCKAWGANGINMAGKTSYAESAEILRKCVMYLGNDSGAMHIAAAVATPCVAIFSARDEVGAWHPYGKQHIVLRREVECQGCMLVECIEQKMKCIRSITVDEVLTACDAVLLSLGMGKQAMTSE